MKKTYSHFVAFVLLFFFSFFLALIPAPSRLSVSTNLASLGVMSFIVILVLSLRTGLALLRDPWLCVRIVICFFLFWLGKGTTDSFYFVYPVPSVWVAFSGFAFFRPGKKLQTIVNISFTLTAFVLAFFPETVFLAYLLVAINGIGLAFLCSTPGEGLIFASVASYSLIVSLSYISHFGPNRFGYWLPLLAFSLGILAPAFYELTAIQKTNEEFQMESDRLALVEEKALKEEIRPHFLLNALNNVRVAYAQDPKKGKEMLSKLIALQKTVTANSERSFIPIQREIDGIRKLVNLFELERGKTVDLEVSIHNKELLIPPLILEPLVENSLQHSGILSQENGWISIEQREEYGYALIRIKDNGVGELIPSQSRGIGLSNVVHRVKLLPGGHMNIESNEKGTSIEIRFALE